MNAIGNIRRLAVPLIGIMALVLALAACGGDDPTNTPTQGPSQGTATATTGAGGGDKNTLIFTDLDWDSAQFQNWVARVILEEAMGYETDSVYGSTLPMLSALITGDANVQTESWYENFQDAYDKAIEDGDIVTVGKTVPDNWQSSFVIPQYVADANPGLRTVEDLKKPEFVELFKTIDSQGKARAWGCIPGWACEQVNQQKADAYGLEDYVDVQSPGSATALTAEIEGSFQAQEPILFYYWGPTPLAGQLDFYRLEEPEYTEECWDTDKACAYPAVNVLISMNKAVADEEPEAVEFLGNFLMTSDQVNAGLARIEETGDNHETVARWWLQNNEDVWTEWVTEEQASAVKSALGM